MKQNRRRLGFHQFLVSFVEQFSLERELESQFGIERL